jgi:hypothetical protein
MTDEQGFNIFKTMATMDRRWVFLLIFLISLGISIVPLGIPLQITEYTKIYHAEASKVEEGDYILSNWNLDYAGYGELKGGILAVHRLFIEKGTKFAITYTYPAAVAVMDICWGDPDTGKPGLLTKELEAAGYEYMKDWIILGYVTFNEASVVAMGEDFQSIIRSDWKGKPIEDSFLSDVTGANDFALVSEYSRGGYAGGFFVKHWGVGFGIPCIKIVNGVQIPGAMADFDAGLTQGFLGSTMACAEFEQIERAPGFATQAMDVFTIIHYMLVVVLIIGNIGYFGWERNQRRGATMEGN